ncbi:MAG: FAD-dependent oxidoreductase [Firmicutes bacterium]|nr:FAD-dependent oxidoreductase [Bacillota bacterium]
MKSIFENDFKGFSTYHTLDSDIDVDVAIIGGGIAGLLCAYHLSLMGIKSTVFEARRIAGATTAKSTAVLTALQSPMYKDLSKKNNFAGDYIRAHKEALELYKQIIAENNIECDFEIKPAYLYASDEKSIKKLQKEFINLQNLDNDAVWTDTRFGPAIKMEDQAQFNLLKFLDGIPFNFDIYENTRIVDFILDKGLLISQSGHKIKANKIVIATRFPPTLSEVYYFKMYQAKSYVIAFKADPLDGTYTGSGDESLYMRSYGEYIILGGFDHRAGRHKKDVNYYDKLKIAAKKYFAVDENEINYAWSAMDSVTYDKVPFAGSLSKKHTNTFIITGFNEWGVLNAMICSRIVANAIANKKDEYFKVYSTHRPYCSKNFGSFLPHALIAAGSLIKGLFQGKKRCGHIGCGLRFNSIENVYECPCHGSRYDNDGNLLDGPSTKCIEVHKK